MENVHVWKRTEADDDNTEVVHEQTSCRSQGSVQPERVTQK